MFFGLEEQDVFKDVCQPFPVDNRDKTAFFCDGNFPGLFRDNQDNSIGLFGQAKRGAVACSDDFTEIFIV